MCLFYLCQCRVVGHVQILEMAEFWRHDMRLGLILLPTILAPLHIRLLGLFLDLLPNVFAQTGYNALIFFIYLI